MCSKELRKLKEVYEAQVKAKKVGYGWKTKAIISPLQGNNIIRRE